jgi:hypothetical protein
MLRLFHVEEALRQTAMPVHQLTRVPYLLYFTSLQSPFAGAEVLMGEANQIPEITK